MKDETIQILKDQIAELKQLIALKDQRITELSCRPVQYPSYPTYPVGYPYTIWTSGTIGYSSPAQPQQYKLDIN